MSKGGGQGSGSPQRMAKFFIFVSWPSGCVAGAARPRGWAKSEGKRGKMTGTYVEVSTGKPLSPIGRKLDAELKLPYREAFVLYSKVCTGHFCNLPGVVK